MLECMNPNDTGLPPVNPEGHNPYGFIMDTQHQQKKKVLSGGGGGNGLKSRILVLIGGGIVLITLFILASSLLFGNKDSAAQLLLGVTAQQQEIVRVADAGIKNATDPSVTAFAQTIKSAVSSEQRELITLLGNAKTKVSPEILASRKSTRTDSELSTASKSNNYNETFNEIMRAYLNTYKAEIERSHTAASSAKTKELLKKFFDSTNTLLL